mgnify:CR=1 FL=1
MGAQGETKTTNADLRNAQEFFLAMDKAGVDKSDMQEAKDHFDTMVDYYLNENGCACIEGIGSHYAPVGKR